MWKAFFLGAVFVISASATAQDITTRQSAPPKAIKAWERALTASRADRTDEALKYVEAALKSAPNFIDAILLRAGIRYQQGAYAAAEADFERVLGIAPDYDPQAWHLLAMSQLRQEKYGPAAEHFERFLQSPVRSEAMRERAARYLANARFAENAVKNPVPFNPQPLDDSINTSLPESLPSLTADGGMLVFTRIVDRQEDFFFSLRLPGGEWSRAKPLEGINTPFNEGAQSISADGHTLVFNTCNTPGGFGSCDLYISHWKNGRWTQPQNLGEPVNTKWLERQPSLSADGRAIIFSSDRPGGFGSRDLWLTRLQPGGKWSAPVNLGPVVNTPSNEDCPFLHADGRTLYFMSDGHPGMGGFDLFLSRITPDGQFNEPENLGYPINTPANEGALIISLDGAIAYFTSDAREPNAKPGDNPAGINTDIFNFAMPPHLRPNPVTYVKAVVRDARTRRPLEAAADLYLLPDNRMVQSDRAGFDGAFLYCLPIGSNYALHVEHEGYLFHSEHFKLDSAASMEKPFLLEIGLWPITTEETAPIAEAPVILRNIFFNTGSAEFLPESKAELERLLLFLKENASMRIQINGHTDNVGSEQDNLLLSERRAKAVYDYLIAGGIAAERLRYRGFGESAPIDANETPQGRRNNRRTEFVRF